MGSRGVAPRSLIYLDYLTAELVFNFACTCTLYKGRKNKHDALFPDIYYSPKISITVNRLCHLTTTDILNQPWSYQRHPLGIKRNSAGCDEHSGYGHCVLPMSNMLMYEMRRTTSLH